MIAITDTRRGGTEARYGSLAPALRDLGWEILFVTLRSAGPVLDEVAAQGIATRSLDLARWTDLPRAAFQFRDLSKEWGAKVVQCALFHANVLGRVSLAGSGVPVISGYEVVDEWKPLGRVVVDRLTHRLSPAHVAVSEAVARRITARERIPSSRIRIIPTGIEPARWRDSGDQPDFRARHGIPAEAPLIGWAARLAAQKDIRTLLRAQAELDGWWLAVAGTGEQAPFVATWVQDAGVSDRCVLLGELADVRPLLHAADVFCLATHDEGLPVALLEAMAAGCAVVATDVGGIPELITHGVNGRLVPRGDHRALADALRVARERSVDLAANALTTVESRYSHQGMVSAFDQLWREMAPS